MNQRYSASDFGDRKAICIDTFPTYPPPPFKFSRFRFNSWANCKLTAIFISQKIAYQPILLKISAFVSHAIGMSCLSPHPCQPLKPGKSPIDQGSQSPIIYCWRPSPGFVLHQIWVEKWKISIAVKMINLGWVLHVRVLTRNSLICQGCWAEPALFMSA